MRRRPRTALLLLLALLVGGGVWWVVGDTSRPAARADITVSEAAPDTGPAAQLSGVPVAATLEGADTKGAGPRPAVRRLAVRLLSQGVPVAGQTVSLRMPDQPRVAFQASRTGAEGWARFALTDGTYVVGVQPREESVLGLGVSLLESRTASLWPLQRVEIRGSDPDPLIVDLPARTLGVEVDAGGAAEQLETISLRLMRTGERGARAELVGLRTRLDADGRARFHMLPPGVYDLHVSSPWHRIENVAGIDLNAGDVQQRLQARATGRLSVRLVDERGEGVAIRESITLQLDALERGEDAEIDARVHIERPSGLQSLSPSLVLEGKILPGVYRIMVPDHRLAALGGGPSRSPGEGRSVEYQPVVLLRPAQVEIVAGEARDVKVTVAYRPRVRVLLEGDAALRENARVVIRTREDAPRVVRSAFRTSPQLAFDGYMPRGSYRVSVSGEGINTRELDLIVDEDAETLTITLP